MGPGNDVLNLTSNAQATKSKINKWNYMKQKSFAQPKK